MESIAELRQICQTTAKKDRSNIYMRYVCRFLSIYLTRMLLPTKVTANQVSLAMIVTGVISSLSLIGASRITFFIGAMLLQAWYLLDCMDGEVARYRHYQKTGSIILDKKDSSLTGMYYDIINHYIVNFMVPVCVGMGLFHKTGKTSFVYLGLIAALTQELMLAMHDGKTRAQMEHLKKWGRVEILKAVPSSSETKRDRHPGHLAFMWLHYSVTYPTVMNLVLIAAALEMMLPETSWRMFLLFYLAAVTLLVSTTIITRNITRQIAEQEFRSNFKVAEA